MMGGCSLAYTSDSPQRHPACGKRARPPVHLHPWAARRQLQAGQALFRGIPYSPSAQNWGTPG